MLQDTFNEFRKLFSREDVAEPEIQAFMEEHSEVIPTPFMLGHELQWNAVISQFAMDLDKKPDFAYITKNTGQWRIVFVELERPQKRVFVDKPYVSFHSDAGYAISQIEEWKTFVGRHQEEVIGKLEPLMQPRDFRKNPVEFCYLLIIGRNPEPTYPTTEHSGRIKRLLEEANIQLCTYDSILRMGPYYGIGRPKNILSQSQGIFKFKRGQADTTMFANFNPYELTLPDEQAAWFIREGYDIDAWRKGEKLSVNHKLPWRRNGEMIDRMSADIAQEAQAKKTAGSEGTASAAQE